jgi:hypothetical protein
MSLGTRVMFVDDDRITRVSLRRFERLFQGDPTETMPECAGQRVRCAVVYVDLTMRKPTGVARVDYMVLTFGPDGRLDEAKQYREGALVGEMMGRAVVRASEPVVEFGPYLAGRQYRTEFKWEPTAQQAEAVIGIALER